MEFWSFVVFEFWSFVVLEFWSFGVLEVWRFGEMWLLLLLEVFLLSVSVSWVFSGVNFTNTSCLVCLGFGMFCLRHGVYIFYGLRDVGGILTFHSFWWWSVVCDNPLSVILTFFCLVVLPFS